MSGFIRDDLRLAIYQRDGFTCLYCTHEVDPYEVKRNAFHPELELDHVVARVLGGSNDPTNLVTCCLPCNDLKHGKTLEEFILRRGLDEGSIRRRLYLAARRRLTRHRKRSKPLVQILSLEKEARCPWCKTTCMHCLVELAKGRFLEVGNSYEEDQAGAEPCRLPGPEEGGDPAAGSACGSGAEGQRQPHHPRPD